MSTPFWIFMIALSAICLWALVSRNLFSRRIAAHAKAEEALEARMVAFKERVSARNTRVIADKPKERSTDDKSRMIPTDDFLKDLYVSDALGRVMVDRTPGRYRIVSPGRFAGGGGVTRAVLLDNGTCLWVEDSPLIERLTSKLAFGQFGYEDAPRGADYTKPPKPIFKRTR